MKYNDLRDFVAKLKQLGELKEVAHPVSPYLEMTELCDRTLRAEGPALLFTHPKDHHTGAGEFIWDTTARSTRYGCRSCE